MLEEIESLFPDAKQRLEVMQRAGWVARGVKDPETVWEHIEALVALGREVLPSMPDFQGMRGDDLLIMLKVHDLPEADPAIGDEIELISDPLHRRMERHRRQKVAMERMCAALPRPYGNRILGYWHRFAVSQDEVAKFARALDKYQPIELAYFYERTGRGPVGLGDEFLNGSPPIEHPLLAERLRRKRISVLV
jgi:5'-deoxynucleotidase YfbR-like HD superfamily hydrolase